MRKRSLRTLVTAAFATAAVTPVLMLTGAQIAVASVGSNIVGTAEANLGHGACDTNSAGGSGYYTSCGESWCADFARWVWAQNGVNVSGLTSGAGSFGQYGSGLHSTPRVGDAAVFNYNGSDYAEHVSLVVSVNSDGSVGTIGGNQGNSQVTRGTITAGGMYGSKHVSGYVSPIGGRGSSAGTESGGAGRVRWADFDGDGRADYVILNDNGSARVFLNKGGDGHGGWSDLGQVTTGMTSDRSRVRFADYDGDGRADYILINGDGSVRVFLNKGGDGHGGWSDLGQVATGLTANPAQVTFADFDGDGRTDYVITQPDGAVGVFRNTGIGSWSDLGKVAGGVTSDTSRIKWADIDGDGRADYNIVNPDGSITSYVNHGGDTGGGWTLRSKITTGLTSNQNTVDLADINGDGRADYLVTTGPTTAFLNNGGDDRNNPGWIDYGQIAAGA
ncbi:FG-GAP-like repeat-containing protein [Streptomyces sp. CB02056]|uniref:FG-GAP-like repeat-containing protein n=2 Tax=Streptomycetaceae TaxID=2062 RepID=UPI00093FD7D1|nr:FG-GAP-like repeat-containing protein [Streptomyces sp. CB02056]